MKIKRDKGNEILNVEGKVADAREQLARCFPVVLFIMLYKVVLTFKSVDEILWFDHSNESYWAVLSCGSDTLCNRPSAIYLFTGFSE